MRVLSFVFSFCVYFMPFICVILADYAVKKETPKCSCDPAHCRVHKYSFNQEVVIVAEGKTDHTKWIWQDITTVIATETVDEAEAQKLMCTAHQNHANFAFIEKVPIVTNTSDPVLSKWLNKVIKKRDGLYADYIALDLLELLGQCTADSSHVTQVLDLLKFIVTKSFTTLNAELLCIVPYKPPCYNGDCTLSRYMAEHCAAFITSPESFITCDTNTNCIAKATMPMTAVVIGVELYIDHGISPDKLIIGIPWHGYDYTCMNFTKNKKAGGRKDEMTCQFYEKNDTNTCDTKLRKKISLAEIKTSYAEQYKSAKSHHFQKIYRSDYINVKKNGVQHQIWYEGHDSLLDKYMFIRSLQLKGMVIWTGDDLSTKGIEDDMEWNWILHGLFSKGEIKEHNLSMAGTVAGISVACFVLGSLLGFAFGCALMRRRMNRRGLRLPFHKDEEETDFHDDDNTL